MFVARVLNAPLNISFLNGVSTDATYIFGRHESKIKSFYNIFDARFGPTLIKNSLSFSAMDLCVMYFDFIDNNVFRKYIIFVIRFANSVFVTFHVFSI